MTGDDARDGGRPPDEDTADEEAAADERGGEEAPGDRDPLDFGPATPPAEWAVAIVGAVLALTVIAMLVVHAVRTPAEPPVLATQVLPADANDVGFLVRVDIRNTGGRSASDVNVVGELEIDGEVVEEATATVEYIPAGTARSVLLQFATDPSRGRIEISGLGFSEE